MPTFLIDSFAGHSPCLLLAHECSRHFRVWTNTREWFPFGPDPSRKDPRDRSVNLLETVQDVVERPSGQYAISLVDKKNGSPVTLYERMSVGLSHFKKTGEHWETGYWTVCAGSVCYDVYVPLVRWFRGAYVIHFTQAERIDPDSRVLYVAW